MCLMPPGTNNVQLRTLGVVRNGSGTPVSSTVRAFASCEWPGERRKRCLSRMNVVISRPINQSVNTTSCQLRSAQCGRAHVRIHCDDEVSRETNLLRLADVGKRAEIYPN